MPTPTSQSAQIGEILVPGAELYGARTFMLTKPAGPDPRAVELVFGLLTGEVRRQVVDTLVERVIEAARATAFAAELDPEKRFEAALRRVNSVILGFLHEEGLSLPGTKLRGAFGLLSGSTLFLAGRGTFQGHVVLPRDPAPAVFEIFGPAEDWTSPKFFASYQQGPLATGSRLYVASNELFEALGRDYVLGCYADPDPARAARELKAALRATKLPVSLISLVMPMPNQAEPETQVRTTGDAGGGAPSAGAAVASTAGVEPAAGPVVRPVAPRRPVAAAEQVADVGGLVSRGAQAAVTAATDGLKNLPKTISVATTGAASAATASGRALRRAYDVTTAGLRDDQGRLRLSKVKRAPDGFANLGVRLLNAVPRHLRLPLLALILVAAGLVNAGVYLVRHQALTKALQAYESQLAEVRRLETEIDAAQIYGNTPLVRQDLQALKNQLAALPETTAAEKRGKADVADYVAGVERRLRKEIVLKPESYADLSAVLPSPGPIAAWNGALYAFSGTAPQVAVIKNGTPTKRQLIGLDGGIAQALPATTGLILLGQNGQLGFWNPQQDAVSTYRDASFAPAAPLMFYQGRIYQAKPDGSVVRQSVLDGQLGAEVAALPASGAKVTGLAADGALFLVTADGTVSKTVKGAKAAAFKPTPPNPPATAAANLAVAQQGNLLAFTDAPSGRLFVLDKQNGGPVATAVDEALKGLTALSLDESSGRLFLAFGNAIKSVKLSDLKP